MKKNLICIIMSVVAAVFMVACGTVQNEETETATKPAEEVESVNETAEVTEENPVDEEAVKKVADYVENYKDEFVSGFETLSEDSGTVNLRADGTTIVLEYSSASLEAADEKQLEEFADRVGDPKSILGAFQLAEPAVSALCVELHGGDGQILFSKTYE